jgi:hypothetical protein
MKTYQAVSFKVIRYEEDVIRTSAVATFNANWFTDGSSPSPTSDSFEEGVK